MSIRILIAALLAGGLASATAETTPVAPASYNFEITLKLSEKLVAELTAKNETIIVAAYYYADANEKGAAEIDDMGRITLGDERTELPPASGPVPVNGVIDPARLELTTGPVSVNVNIFSGRKSSEDNLIGCDFIDGPVSELTAQPTEIFCGLLTEDPVTVMKPAKG
ncbi:MAG: hypothetical protein QM698_10145 [Micropepsaceae bacterium]